MSETYIRIASHNSSVAEHILGSKYNRLQINGGIWSIHKLGNSCVNDVGYILI